MNACCPLHTAIRLINTGCSLDSLEKVLAGIFDLDEHEAWAIAQDAAFRYGSRFGSCN